MIYRLRIVLITIVLSLLAAEWAIQYVESINAELRTVCIMSCDRMIERLDTMKYFFFFFLAGTAMLFAVVLGLTLNEREKSQ